MTSETHTCCGSTRSEIACADPSVITSPRVREALLAIENAGALVNWSEWTAQEHDARVHVLSLYGELGRAPTIRELSNRLSMDASEVSGVLAKLRARDAVVRVRTLLVNHVRGAVKAVGARVPTCSTPAFARRARPAVPEELAPAFGAVFALLEDLNRVIASYDRAVAARCTRSYPETARLTQVAGVGPLTALCYVLTLEDPARFARSRTVGAYLGLRPKQASSGERRPQLRITKAGDGMLRRLLVGSAHYILGPFGPDCALRRWGLRLAARGGKNAKKRAVVAVARKLAVLLHRLWTTGDRYDPLRGAADIAMGIA